MEGKRAFYGKCPADLPDNLRPSFNIRTHKRSGTGIEDPVCHWCDAKCSVDEGAVCMDILFLGAKGRVHDDRVAGPGLLCYRDIPIDKFHICTEEPGVLLCDTDGIIVNLDTPNRAGTEQSGANGEDARSASEIADRFSLNVTLQEGIVEEPGAFPSSCPFPSWQPLAC